MMIIGSANADNDRDSTIHFVTEDNLDLALKMDNLITESTNKLL